MNASSTKDQKTDSKDVVVIGAGVIGLQIAVTLLEAGHRVTIIAKDFPGDGTVEYTSMWAGAQWRPHGTLESDPEQCDWDLQSYHAWMDEIKADPVEAEKRGLQAVPMTIYASTTSSPSFWFTQYLRSSNLPPSSLPTSAKAGIEFTTIACNAPLHILSLIRKATSLGATLVRATLTGPLDHALDSAIKILNDIPNKTSLKSEDVTFILATGLLSASLIPDPAITPIYGQTVLVRGSAPRLVTLQPPAPSSPQPSENETKQEISYIIPRPGSSTTVLGGTNIPLPLSPSGHVRIPSPDPEITRSILHRAKKLWPDGVNPQTGEFDVLRVNVGVRPGRKGGARVERDNVGGREVVYAYGHGGAGFQNSVGVARKVLGLVEGRRVGRVYMKGERARL